jgi:hypothetical protein
MGNIVTPSAPTRSGLEGNFQAQPRVFAHDAKTIVVGAINESWGGQGIEIKVRGVGYTVGDSLTQSKISPTTSSGTGFTATVEAVNSVGGVTELSVTGFGNTYDELDVITLSGGTTNSCEVTVLNIDIPNTGDRGCCLYVGVAGDVSVVMEGGTSVTFKGVAAGSFLPVQVVQVTSTISASGDILALF